MVNGKRAFENYSHCSELTISSARYGIARNQINATIVLKMEVSIEIFCDIEFFFDNPTIIISLLKGFEA